MTHGRGARDRSGLGAPVTGGAPRAGRRLSIGIVLPQEEGPGDPAPSWKLMSTAARVAEDVGLDAVWLVDHFLWERDPWGRDPGDFGEADDPAGYGTREAWTTLSALAAMTSRIRLGTLVTCTRYRNPALLAKMADTVDEISGGRLILGLGGGDNRREHERFGYPSDRPVSHFEEALEIIVPLLRNGHVDYDGSAYSAHAELKPRGPRTGGPPILIGSLAGRPRVLGLVARHADIWNGWVVGITHASQVPPLRTAVDAACLEIGRDPATLARSMVIVIALGGPMARRADVMTGTLDELAGGIAAFGHEGINEVQVRLFPNDPATIEQFGRVVEAVRHLEGGAAGSAPGGGGPA